jgi:hypothetical protein
MKRHLLILPTLLAFCIAIATAQKKSDREEMELRGPVQRVHTTEQKQLIDSGTWVDDTVSAGQITVFDTKGRIVESRNYGFGFFGETPFTWSGWTMTFDDENHTTLRTYFDEEGEVQYNVLTKYNEQGRHIESILYNSDPGEFESRSIYEHDVHGRMISTTETDRSDSGEKTNVQRVVYDTAGTTFTIISTNSDGSMHRKEMLRIDTIQSTVNMGMRVRHERSVYDERMRALNNLRTVEYYDSLNRKRMDQTYFGSDLDSATFQKEYDEEGRQIVEIEIENVGDHSLKLQWKRSDIIYDEYDNATAQYISHYTAYPGTLNARIVSRDTVTTQLIYDQYGNWIQKSIRKTKQEIWRGIVRYEPWKLLSVVQRREITYFKE